MIYKNLPFEERLFSEKNIYLAIYSVDSYISNKELLDPIDQEYLIKFRDKFNWEFIEDFINKVKLRLEDVIHKDKYLKAKVFFKPKKYDDKPIFRPLHSANLLDQITAVAMLNVLIYDFDEENKISMSNFSRLIPHNFYGNRVAYEPEHLFKPWQKQYTQYTAKANEFYRRFHENSEYKWEVNLDLENFFPTINPICLINYIDQQIPVNYTDIERKLINKLLEKLIFVELDKMTVEDIKRYTGKSEIEECRFAIGLPQGLPQSYFLANLFMINIEEIYKEVLPGEMLFYVDDSAIFTNEIYNIEDFGKKIEEINYKIKLRLNVLYDKKNSNISNTVIDYVKDKKDTYIIHIHKPGEKSTISNIADSKEGEIYIHCIGRETSKTAFEINTSYSDEESKILLNKTAAILQALENELEKTEKKLDNHNIKSDEKKQCESYKKKLIRYKKFFKYRNKDLGFRENININKLKEELLFDLKFLDNIDITEGLLEFFNKYNEDTLGASLNFVLRSLKDYNEDFSEIADKIVLLNNRLFGYQNKETSYLYVAYKEYIENRNTEQIELLKLRTNQYSKLEEIIKCNKRYVNKKTDKVRLELVNKELKLIDKQWTIEKYVCEDFFNVTILVTSNSDTLQRMVLNAVFSSLFMIEISDDVILQKINNRKITYFELRLLELLRNKYFSINKIIALKSDIVKSEYIYSIDYSIMQVLDIFRTFVSNPEYIDNLILVHKYTCDIWKNGSKHLYFYTLHNQEHAVDLIQNSIKLLRAIDYIDISKNDHYVLFIACYLHDISMVTLPKLDQLQANKFETNKIYTDFFKEIKKQIKDSKLAKKEVLKLLKDYYMRIDSFYEGLVRDGHAKDSADEIRMRSELKFIDDAVRDIVADVSEAHGYNVNEVYKIKSKASTKIWSLKYTKIILRLADLLDMSNYRVSKLILDHNLDNMGETSRFHWLSHLVTRGYVIKTEYYLDDKITKHFLEEKSIFEKITLTIDVDLPQITGEKRGDCNCMNLNAVKGTTISLQCGKKCDSDKCNFLCKWFVKKNEYLFMELTALQEYLNNSPDNYFKSIIELKIRSSDKNFLSPKQFTLLKKYVEGK